ESSEGRASVQIRPAGPVEAAADLRETQRHRERRDPHQHEPDRAPGADLRRDLRRHQEDRAADHLIDPDRRQVPSAQRASQAGAGLYDFSGMHLTLPRRFYADPDHYRSELDRFYFNRWICAGRADQIPKPGDYFTRTLG